MEVLIGVTAMKRYRRTLAHLGTVQPTHLPARGPSRNPPNTPFARQPYNPGAQEILNLESSLAFILKLMH